MTSCCEEPPPASQLLCNSICDVVFKVSVIALEGCTRDAWSSAMSSRVTRSRSSWLVVSRNRASAWRSSRIKCSTSNMARTCIEEGRTPVRSSLKFCRENPDQTDIGRVTKPLLSRQEMSEPRLHPQKHQSSSTHHSHVEHAADSSQGV